MFVLLASSTSYAQTLLIFGGESSLFDGKKHDKFLGVLNTSPYDTNSIWNEYGTYGNSYSSNSIWNEYSTYGSEYSNNSPFNTTATNPPVVVDQDGNFYGYLTINSSNSKQCRHPIAIAIYRFYKVIRKDVSEGYKAIFE